MSSAVTAIIDLQMTTCATLIIKGPCLRIINKSHRINTWKMNKNTRYVRHKSR